MKVKVSKRKVTVVAAGRASKVPETTSEPAPGADTRGDQGRRRAGRDRTARNKASWALGLAVVVAAATVGIPAARRAIDRQRLHGPWKVVLVMDNGNALQSEDTAKWSVVFAGNMMTSIQPDGHHEADFRLNPWGRPKGFDANPADGPLKGKKVSGIYEVVGDTLQICLPGALSKEPGKRPGAFVSTPGSELRLMVLERGERDR